MKLFVTVGYQMSFDRLIHAVDEWVGTQDSVESFAQIGSNGTPPTNMEWQRLLEPSVFQKHVIWCDAIVAHAGMGSVLTALEYKKPVLVLPRRGDLRETRNDHQLATARQLQRSRRALVAMDETCLPDQLSTLITMGEQSTAPCQPSPQLLARLRAFVHES